MAPAHCPTPLESIEAAAGDYPLDGQHVAVAGRGARMASSVVDAAASLDAPLLLASAPDGERWAWVATVHVGELRARIGADLPDEPGVVGIAGPLPGRVGFRSAHRRATLAAAAGTLGSGGGAPGPTTGALRPAAGAAGRGSRVVSLDDVALEALVAGDAEDAREVVHAVLGPLAAPGQGPARLRATVEASLAAGTGRDAVADRLRVAPRTVSYRLRRAEDLLGHPIAPRRAELAAALRLFRALGP